MSSHDFEYLKLAERILVQGSSRPDRTGTGTYSLFGEQMKFDLRWGFPLLTTKKVNFKAIVHELLWFLSGSTNVKDLQKNGVHIWDEWADEFGELGPVYGKQWRDWNGRMDDDNYHYDEGEDQIADLVEGLKKDPFGRRHIVTAWNPSELSQQKLPPCHCFFQCYVRENENIITADGAHSYILDLQLYQRSADLFLGVPFNIASYALLLQMLAQVCGMRPGVFVHTFGDVHIYKNHVAQMKEQIGRTSRTAPRVLLNPKVDSIDGFTYDDVILEGYDPHPPIKGVVSV